MTTAVIIFYHLIVDLEIHKMVQLNNVCTAQESSQHLPQRDYGCYTFLIVDLEKHKMVQLNNVCTALKSQVSIYLSVTTVVILFSSWI